MSGLGLTTILLGTGALLLAACGGDDLALTDAPWEVEEFADAAGNSVSPIDGTALSSRFDADQVTGSAGCNGYFGGYQTDGDRITIGPLASTQMFCEGAMDQEAAFLAALQNADAYRISGETLELTQDGDVIVAYTAASTSLEGTAWSLLSMNNGNEAMQSVIVGTEITADFDDEGTVSGSGGCNGYTGSYETDGAAITVGPLAATEMACLDTEGVMDQEARYFTLLDAAATFAIVNDGMQMLDQDGTRLLVFARG